MINSVSPKVNSGNDEFQGASKIVGFDVNQYVFGKDLSAKEKTTPNITDSFSSQAKNVKKPKTNSLLGALLLTGIIGGTVALISSLRGDSSFISKILSKIRAPKV